MNRREFLRKAGTMAATIGAAPTALALLDACGTGSPVSMPTPAKPFKGTLQFWVFGYTPGGATVTGKNFDAAVAGFQKRNPDIQVALTGIPFSDAGIQKVDTALAARSGGPDLFRIASDGLAKYTAQGLIEPIDDYLTASDRSDIFANSLDGVKYKGKHYAFPEWVPPVGFYLNKAVFAERNVAIPSDTWTVDQFLEIAKKLAFTRANGDKVYAWSGEISTAVINTFTFMYAEGATILDANAGKYTFNSAAGVKGLQHMIEMAQQKLTPPDFGSQQSSDIQNAFAKGLLSMYNGASGDIANWRLKKIDVAILAPPIAGAGKQVTVGGLATFPVVKQDDRSRVAAAMKLASYVTGPQVLEDVPTWYLAPATRKSVKLASDPAGMDRFQAMVPFTQLMPSIPQWGQIQQAVSPSLQLAVAGKKTAQQALSEPADQINSLLKS